MKEYWVNIYPGHLEGFKYYSKKEIEDVTSWMKSKHVKLLYRIHVRLK